MRFLRRIWHILKGAAFGFGADHGASYAAAISSYSALSFAPLVVLLIWFGSFLGDDTRTQLVEEITKVLGPQAGQAVEVVIANAQDPQLGTWAGVIGLGTLLFAATAVFAQLQVALNRVWGVSVVAGKGMRSWMRKRLLSLGMVLAIAFLLLMSLVLSTLVGLLLPPGSGMLWEAAHVAILLVLVTVLFTLMYRFLPDGNLPWRVIWPSAAVTALLFVIGKTAVGLYLGHSDVGGSYGAAGSLVVLLVWMYASSLVLLAGAELTIEAARQAGIVVEPERHAHRLARKWPETSEDRVPEPSDTVV